MHRSSTRRPTGASTVDDERSQRAERVRRRIAVLVLAAGCTGAPGTTWVYAPQPGGRVVAPLAKPINLYLGQRDSQWSDFEFDGGSLEFDSYRFHGRVTQIVRNRYAAP